MSPRIVVTDLPEEVLLFIMMHLGNHASGFIMRVVLRRVSRCFWRIPLILPVHADGGIRLCYATIDQYMRCYRDGITLAYDFGNARCVYLNIVPQNYRIISSPLLSAVVSRRTHDSIPDVPPSLKPFARSLRYSFNEDRFAWFSFNRWFTCAASRLRSNMSFTCPKSSAWKEHPPLGSLFESTPRGARMELHADKSFFDTVCRAIQHATASKLELKGRGLYADKAVYFQPFDASKLTSIAINSVRLHSTTVCFLASLTHLQSLDLSDSIVPSTVPLAALAELIHAWHGMDADNVLRKLVLDEHKANYYYLVKEGDFCPLLNAMGCDSMDRITPVSCANAKVFLSCDMLSAGQWDTCFAMKKDYVATPIKLRLAEGGGASTSLAADPPVASGDAPLASMPGAAPKVHCHYTDAKREMDRGMFGWFDYTCRNCGTVWAENSVTVSFRQTAVSECLKNKRPCASRPEHGRMLAGETFLTVKHCIGNGGNDLSPKPEDVVHYAAQGLLVGVNPLDGQYKFFRPHPINVGLKVPA